MDSSLRPYSGCLQKHTGCPPSLRSGCVLQCENMNMRVEVECYSARKADERPVRFRLEGYEYVVEEVLDQWYGPDDIFFKVRADDGNLYILRRQTSAPDGNWHLVSFRELGRKQC